MRKPQRIVSSSILDVIEHHLVESQSQLVCQTLVQVFEQQFKLLLTNRGRKDFLTIVLKNLENALRRTRLLFLLQL